MHLVEMPLALVEEVHVAELESDRIEILLTGYSPFEEVLHSTRNPITLDRPGPPYRIIDGRHRVYLARQRGYTTVLAQCLWITSTAKIAKPRAFLEPTSDDDVTAEAKNLFRTIFLAIIAVAVIGVGCMLASYLAVLSQVL